MTQDNKKTDIRGIGLTPAEARELMAMATARAWRVLDAMDDDVPVAVTVGVPDATITLLDGRTVRFYSVR
jgi:hypothetical protein